MPAALRIGQEIPTNCRRPVDGAAGVAAMVPDDVVPAGKPREADSARALYEAFARRLIGLARVQLDARLRHKIDPEDVVQTAFKSFFLRYGEGALAEEGWDGLWGLLTTITLRKCSDRVRYYTTEGRDLSREAARAASAEPWREAIDREPTPDEAAVLAETVEHLLR